MIAGNRNSSTVATNDRSLTYNFGARTSWACFVRGSMMRIDIGDTGVTIATGAAMFNNSNAGSAQRIKWDWRQHTQSVDRYG